MRCLALEVQARPIVPVRDLSKELAVFLDVNPVRRVAIVLWLAAVEASSSTAGQSLIAGFVSFNHYSTIVRHTPVECSPAEADKQYSGIKLSKKYAFLVISGDIGG